MTNPEQMLECLRLQPGMYVSSESGEHVDYMTVEPEILDVLRVANGIAPQRDAEVKLLLRVKREKS